MARDFFRSAGTVSILSRPVSRETLTMSTRPALQNGGKMW